MRLLNDTLLRDTYDVIVVGAGLGGMIQGFRKATRAEAPAGLPTREEDKA